MTAPLQAGDMLGGWRGTTLNVCDPGTPGQCAAVNPYSNPNYYAIANSRSAASPPALTLTSGAISGQRLDVSYGNGPGGMVRDLGASPTRRIRLTFGALSQPLNFNVLIFSGAGRGQDGCNVIELNRPFVLELPFSEFTPANGGFDPNAVTNIDLAFTDGSAIGSMDFELRKVEISDTALGGAVHCGPLGA